MSSVTPSYRAAPNRWYAQAAGRPAPQPQGSIQATEAGIAAPTLSQFIPEAVNLVATRRWSDVDMSPMAASLGIDIEDHQRGLP
jgi:hypothetical protein